MQHGYRADIDGLRAVAVLGVVLYHAGVPGIAGGFVGVDVFFVISGFLITSLLLSELGRSGRIDFPAFYARRARRLLPTFLLVLGATLAAGLWLLSPALGEVQSLGKAAIAALLMAANVFYLRRLESYFSGPAEMEPLLHTWSLSVEEQFYLVWPAALAAAWWLGTRFGRPRVAVAVVIGAVIAASALTCWLWAGWRNPWAFYLLPARAWELGAGGALALAIGGGVSARRRLGAAAGLAGLLTVLAAMAMAHAPGWFPAPAAAVPVAGTLLIILGNAWHPGGPVARLLRWRPLVAVGLASYAWYLWHWPALSLARIVSLGEADLVRDAGIAAATLLLSLVTLKWFESPIRYRQLGPGRRVLGGAFGAASIAIAAAGLAWLWAERTPPTPAEARLIAARRDTSPMWGHCHVGLGMAGSDRLVPCLAPDGAGRLLLWGDSYADHWAPALADWSGRQTDVPVVEQLTKDACPPLPGALPTEPRAGRWKPYDGCRAFNDRVGDRLAVAAGSPRAAVVIASAWWFRATDFDLSAGGWFLEPAHSFDVAARGEAASLEVLERRLGETLVRLRDQGLRAVLVLQSPQLIAADGRRLRAPECLFRKPESACAIPAALHHARVATVHAAIRRVAAGFDNVRLFDPAAALCDAVTCPARIDGLVAYTDDGHVSATMSRRLAAGLGPLLDWAMEAAGQQRDAHLDWGGESGRGRE